MLCQCNPPIPGAPGANWCEVCRLWIKERQYRDPGRKGQFYTTRRKRELKVAKFLKKQAAPSAKNAASTAGAGGQFAKDFPAIWEYVSTDKWDGGAPRELASLILFLEDGRWKICLSDRENSRTGWSSGDTFSEALECLEDALVNERVEWRKKWEGKQWRGKKRD